MPTNDLFNGADTTVIPQVDPNKNYVEELVGEGKKFKSVEELARGKAEADAFIARLLKEQEEMRQDLNQRARLGDIVDQLASLKPKEEEVKPNPQTLTASDALSPEKVQEMVNNLLAEREQTNTRSTNLSTVQKKLQEVYGENYASKLVAKANELGLSKDALNDLAAKSPQAFFTLVGVNNTTKSNNNDVFTPPNGQRVGVENRTVERTKSFYDNLKKTDAVRYWDKATQNQMHQDAVRLGPAFFDN